MMYASDRFNYGDVAERLRTEMKACGLTQSALSKETGISSSRISKILNGKWEFLSDGFWLKLRKCEKINYTFVKFGI